MLHMTHDHDTRQADHFKNMYCRTTLKLMCLSIRGPVINYTRNSTNVNMFKKRYKTFMVSEYSATSFIAEIAISKSYFFVYHY